jgi:hypothetical protein
VKHQQVTNAVPEAKIRIWYYPPYGAPRSVGETIYIWRGSAPDGTESLFYSTSLLHGGRRGWDEGWGYSSLEDIAKARCRAFYRANEWRGIWQKDISAEIVEEKDFPPALLTWWSHQMQAAFGQALAASGGVAALVNRARGVALVDASPDPTYAPRWEDSQPTGWELKSIDSHPS